MEDMEYCKVCLVTDCKMFSSPSISEAYSKLVQVVPRSASMVLHKVQFSADYKLYVCYECKHLLRKCQEFRSKCMMALNVLSSIHMDHSKIPKRIVRDIDRKHFKLESQVSLSSMLLVCNSNKQMMLPETDLDSDIKREIDTNPDALEDDKSETKFAIYAEGKDPCSDSYIKIEIGAFKDNKLEKKIDIDAEDVFSDVETQDTNNPNEIIQQSSHEPNKILPEIKSEQKCQLKSNKTKENVPKRIQIIKRITRKKKLEPLSASSILRRAPSQNTLKMMQMKQNYATIDEMTPSEAKEEMLLRKESRNYKISPYSCELCYKGFSMESTYNNHMKLHSPDSGTVKCDVCHLFFRIRKELMKHIGACHKYKITCKSCPYVCFSLSQAQTHFAIHTGESYKCEQCGKIFRLAGTLSNHKRVKHPNFVCAHCGSMFSALAGLKNHKHRAHKQDSAELLGPKCEECDVQFATETAWKRHLVLSSKHTVSNGCEECGETFLTADELKRHAKEHPRKLLSTSAYYAKVAEVYKTEPKFKPADCKLCDIRLETYFEYTEHMKSEHPNTTAAKKVVRRQAEVDNIQYICESCGKEFKSRTLLKYHTNKHTGELPYECEQCDKKYADPAPLYRHKAIHHTGAPRFKCDVCQKGFHVKSMLRKHMMMVHLRICRFQCEVCYKSYGQQSALREHMEYVHFKKPRPKGDRTKRRNVED